LIFTHLAEQDVYIQNSTTLALNVWGLPCPPPLSLLLFKILKLIPENPDEMKAFSSNILDANLIKFQTKQHQTLGIKLK